MVDLADGSSDGQGKEHRLIHEHGHYRHSMRNSAYDEYEASLAPSSALTPCDLTRTVFRATRADERSP